MGLKKKNSDEENKKKYDGHLISRSKRLKGHEKMVNDPRLDLSYI
jgi:hypothetical protein